MLSAIDILPPQCQQANAQGQMPTCVQHSDGTWSPIYPGTDSGAFSGIAAFIGVAFVVVLVLGILATTWRVRTARRLAESAGLDAGDATAMTLLTPDGLAATYVASSLRSAPTAPASSPTIADRLRGLNDLKQQGLITDDEYVQRRSAIINEA